MPVDVNAWIGTYPFHGKPRWTTSHLIAEITHFGIAEAWVSHLGSAFGVDPEAGNADLYAAFAADSRLRPVPTVDPTRAGWTTRLDVAVARSAPAVRYDPALRGLPPIADEVHQLLAACAGHDLPLIMAVRLEDLRQRDPEDVAADLPPWAIRQLIRSHPTARLIVTHADRDVVEQVHFGATPDEAGRMLWDISCIWGPPEDHLELLLRTVGIERFTFGTGMPLRLPENSVAKLDLLQLDARTRTRISGGNLRAFVAT